jgi:hypothetical protein
MPSSKMNMMHELFKKKIETKIENEIFEELKFEDKF